MSNEFPQNNLYIWKLHKVKLNMEMLWTWGGKFFGYSDGGNLWTHNGVHVGRFVNDMIYGSNGKYLGEVKNNRLITNKSRKSSISGTFAPYTKRIGIVTYVDYVGNVMYSGYEDFPLPETFE